MTIQFGLSFKITPIALLLSSVLYSSNIWADSTVRYVNLEEQPLDQALQQFARQSNVQILYVSDLVKDLRVNSIQGEYAVEQVFRQLLENKPLQLKQLGPQRYSIIAKTQEQSVVEGSVAPDLNTMIRLPVIELHAQEMGGSEESASYTSAAMNTATGLKLSARETPQSVSVISHQRMQDQGMITAESALDRTTGITVTATGGERSHYSSRGFQVDNIMIDGVPMSHDSDTLGSASLAMYDRIEVVRGATGLMEGAGNPSASINFVRKRPTYDPQFIVSAGLGSWQNYMGMFDVSGPLNQEGTIRGRAVTSLQDSATQTEDYKHKRQLYYGIVEADLGDKTRLSLGGYYNEERNPGADWNGLPTRPDGSFYDFERSVRSSPAWSYWNKENSSLFAELQHEFVNNWLFTFKANYLDVKLDMLGASLYRPDPEADRLNYNIGKYFYHHKQTAFDANLLGDYSLFGRNHQFVVGANYRNNKGDDGPGGWPTDFPYQFDPLNWQHSIAVPYPDLVYLWERQSEERDYGIYANTKLNITPMLNLFLGGRLSWSKTTTHFKSGGYQENTDFDAKAEFSPYIAASYDLNKHLTVYGSMTDIFKPQNNRMQNGGFLEPVKGTNYEIGLKGEWLDGQLNSSVAIFQIDQVNLAQQVVGGCGGIDCYTAAGKVRSRGAEVEISGELRPHWNLYAGYTYVDSRYMNDSTGGQAGQRYGRNLPQNIVTFSTMYQLPYGLEKWKIGASSRLQSKTAGTVLGVVNAKQGGYGLLDLTAIYAPNPQTELRANFYNIFDRYYYKSVGYSDNANILGDGRNFMLSASYKF